MFARTDEQNRRLGLAHGGDGATALGVPVELGHDAVIKEAKSDEEILTPKINMIRNTIQILQFRSKTKYKL